jgi:hypothetical protein
MAPKLPTIMTPHVPNIARPVVHVDEDGVVYVHAATGPCLTLAPDPSGALVLGTRARLAPAGAAVLRTKSEMSAELGELLEPVAMSKTARAAIERVLDEYGR